MGIPHWMLSIDNRKTKVLYNGACIQFLLHFKGKWKIYNFYKYIEFNAFIL